MGPNTVWSDLGLARLIKLMLFIYCCLFPFPCEAPQNYSHTQRNPHVYYRHEVINQLQQTHSLVKIVADNLATYMQKVHTLIEGKGLETIISYKLFSCRADTKL